MDISHGSVCLGEYRFDMNTGHFKQLSSLRHDHVLTPFIFFDFNQKTWFVGPTPGKDEGCLANPSRSPVLPTSRWQYIDEDLDDWVEDPSIEIYPGKIEPCPAINAQFLGPVAVQFLQFHGMFTTNGTTVHGRYVYFNQENMMLHVGIDGHWFMGYKFNTYGIRSSDGPLCPSEATGWMYGDSHFSEKPIQMKLSCIHKL